MTEYDLTIVPEPTAEEGGRRSTGYLMTDTRRDGRQRRAYLLLSRAGGTCPIESQADESLILPLALRAQSTLNCTRPSIIQRL